MYIQASNAQHSAYGLADFNFAAVGDWGCGSNTDNTINNIVGKSPEYVIGLGDYSYESTGTCWFNKIAPIDSITRITIGNHEDGVTEGFDGYMNHFGLSQTYYSYDYENAHIIVLDTDRNSYLQGSAQYNFVVNDLQSASQNPNLDWIIAYFHQPMYTSPATCCSALAAFRDTYHPLFDQYGVDLVLQGHVHNYQRTFPLKYNVNSPINPIQTNQNSGEYLDPEGQVFAVVGTGGVGLHALSGKSSFVSNQQVNFFGQLDVKITQNGNKLEGRYYRNDNGAVLDSFSITKNAAGGSGTYQYTPSYVLTGSNYQDQPSSASLQLSQFSASAWFKTSTNFAADALIVNKGGSGSDSAGNNMNYGIWMTSTEQIKAGFETSTGADQFVTSPNKYNDGQWHYAVVTNSGTNLVLYIDGVQVATKSTSGASPEQNTKPFRVGANSRVTPPTNFFIGEIDEVRVWNDDLTSQEASDAFSGTAFNTGDQVLHLPFDLSGANGYHYSPNFVLSGDDSQDANSPSLSQFSLASWFKTSTNFAADALIVNKGGSGSDSAGNNMNYGIWMTSTEQIKAGFETSTGADQFVTSPNKYNDGQWHYAVVTNSGTNLVLYIDGVQVATKSTSGASPEQNTKPFRVGANSRVTPPTNFFIGEIDEVRVWNDDLTSQEVANAFSGTSFNTAEQVLYLPFDSNSPPVASSQEIKGTKNMTRSLTLNATDANNDILNFTIVIPTTNGTLSGTPPNLVYNPDTNFVGTDHLTFKASDGIADSNSATVTITIQDPESIGSYQYAPSFVLSGDDSQDANSPSLSQFSLASWFKTSSDFASDVFVANKGGSGSDSAGNNMNYGIWMTSTEQIKAGFETSTGADQFVTSPNKYNDGQWHYAVVTNSGTNLVLYIDGVQVATKSTSGASPEQNTKPFRVGANSRVTPPTNFFIGEIDEVRVWNDDLTSQEVANAFSGTSFKSETQVLYLDFNSVSLTGEYVYDPSLSLSGPP